MKVWRLNVSVVWVTSRLLLHPGEVDEFREGYINGQEDSVRVSRYV